MTVSHSLDLICFLSTFFFFLLVVHSCLMTIYPKNRQKMKSKAQEMKYNAKTEMRETLNPGYERKSDTSSDEDSKEEAGDDYD